MFRMFYKIIYNLFIINLCQCLILVTTGYGQNNKHGYQMYNAGNEGVLPVEIMYFKFEIESYDVKLLWGTSTEKNNFGWDIQRSEDYIQWNKIGFVFGSGGQSDSPKDYSYIDTTITKNGTYYYRLKQIDTDGLYSYTDPVKVEYNLITGVKESSQLLNFELKQNYPNPFNPFTNIIYKIPEHGFVILKLFNSLGKEIEVLVNEEKSAGIYNLQFSIFSHQLSSGIYFYEIEFQSDNIKYSSIRKMILLK